MKPALVIFPGLDGGSTLLADFAASFGPDIEVIVVAYPLDLEAGYAEHEHHARSFLPVDRPYFLLGESFSGPVAIAIAADSPPGLLGLILCCTFARSPIPFLAPFRFLISLLPIKSLPLGVLRFFTFGRFASAKSDLLLQAALKEVPVSTLRGRARAVLTVDVREELQRIRVPLLYLRALEDRLLPRHCATLITTMAKNCRLVEFVAPHFLLQASPQKSARTVEQFMQLEKSTPGRMPKTIE